MTEVIYVSTGALSSKLLKSHIEDLENAKTSLSEIGNSPMYKCMDMKKPLYSSGVLEEINGIKSAVSSVISQLEDYGRVLDTGPDALVAVDASYKSEITAWYERADYHVDGFFADIKTGWDNIVDFWVDDYKNKGWSYKLIQSVAAVGRAAPAIIGCAASWVTAPLVPTTWLSTAYGLNAAVSMWADLDNIWNENYDAVGNVNYLKSMLVEGGGELSEMLCGNEKIGEIIGNGIYGLGEITTSVTNKANMNKLKGITETTSRTKAVGEKIKEKFGGGEKGILGLRGRVIQSDYSFQNVKDSIKEAPKAIKGLWDIATNSSLTELAKDYKLFSYTIPNIMETASTIELLSDVATTTSDLTTKGIEFVKIITKKG